MLYKDNFLLTTIKRFVRLHKLRKITVGFWLPPLSGLFCRESCTSMADIWYAAFVTTGQISELLSGMVVMQAGDLITQQVSHGVESAAPAPPMTAGQVTAFGPGLSHGIAGQQCNFTIVTKDAGAGQQTNCSISFPASSLHHLQHRGGTD